MTIIHFMNNFDSFQYFIISNEFSMNNFAYLHFHIEDISLI